MARTHDPISTFLEGQRLVGAATLLQESRELIMDATDDILTGPLVDLVNVPLEKIGETVLRVASEYATIVTERPDDGEVLRVTVNLMGLMIAAYAQVMPDVDELEQEEEDE